MHSVWMCVAYFGILTHIQTAVGLAKTAIINDRLQFL